MPILRICALTAPLTTLAMMITDISRPSTPNAIITGTNSAVFSSAASFTSR